MAAKTVLIGLCEVVCVNGFCVFGKFFRKKDSDSVIRYYVIRLCYIRCFRWGYRFHWNPSQLIAE